MRVVLLMIDTGDIEIVMRLEAHIGIGKLSMLGKQERRRQLQLRKIKRGIKRLTRLW